ncbi:hypothetical protein AAE02nite_33570 [Adhaeribacter aerolatus]|uniref:Uncharacterized protein n=1 Tax=Adhaeribacter aerolatus TaxID=670289 RepID=A0A512B166_9BACT|nr:hypothetical protein [Adhaeribacter aerolatus]GEO05693.1 hypothetical protein AAE02nite_33570 [Adhaeribacter aerolatus]
MTKNIGAILFFTIVIGISNLTAQHKITPADIGFVRQGVQRLIFDPKQSILLATLEPANIIGLAAMHPQTVYSPDTANITINKDVLTVKSQQFTETGIWLGGCNPFATYSMQVAALKGTGAVGFEFTNAGSTERFQVFMKFAAGRFTDVILKIVRNQKIVLEKSIRTNPIPETNGSGELILQLFGSGLNFFVKDTGLPVIVAQANFNQTLDLRQRTVINTFQSRLLFSLTGGEVAIRKAQSAITTGAGQADIRVITRKDGSPYLDQGRLWYTLSIRGRALDHHVQGVFSLNPSAFDLKLEGIIVFDREDGLLRNEISSHLFYDGDSKTWRGFTTGFSFAANPQTEKKQIWAIESKTDPRFGLSVMKAKPTNIIGDFEDSHVLYDAAAKKWRMLTCENIDGYKAVLLQSDKWDGVYKRLAGPVKENSTGTSMQQIGGKWYCFSGSAERKIFVYTYPDLKPAGTLKMDLPPWDAKAGTRVWPNIVALPDGYPVKYVALMMDRYNYPGMKGPNWTYGALYLYHGSTPSDKNN